MMKIMKKSFSVFLAVLILLSCFSAASYALTAEGSAENIPILRIRGEQAVYAKGADGNYHEL